MMDPFIHPEDIAHNASFVLRQLPKKAHGELKASVQHFAMKDAWGIVFQEDWHWPKIGWILALGFFLPSLLFLTLWATLMKDMQGGAGIASWWVTGATIVVGLIGTYS
jgi:hypothetical protein